jgi:hypothetical protein
MEPLQQLPDDATAAERPGEETTSPKPDVAPPAPAHRETAREAEVVGIIVQVREDDSVWQDLVAETDLWRKFEVVDQMTGDEA